MAKCRFRLLLQRNFCRECRITGAITSLEFKTPKGTSYHGKGISPKYECEREIVNDTCAALVANKIYGVKIPKQEKSALAKHFTETTDDIKEFEGGAIEWADSDIYFKTFEKTYP